MRNWNSINPSHYAHFYLRNRTHMPVLRKIRQKITDSCDSTGTQVKRPSWQYILLIWLYHVIAPYTVIVHTVSECRRRTSEKKGNFFLSLYSCIRCRPFIRVKSWCFDRPSFLSAITSAPYASWPRCHLIAIVCWSMPPEAMAHNRFSWMRYRR